MNNKTQENIEEIVNIIKEAKTFDGYKMSRDAHIKLHEMRGRLIKLSDGDVDIYFERTNSNVRIGMYKITLKCTDEVEQLINQYLEK